MDFEIKENPVMSIVREIETVERTAKCSEQAAALAVIVAELRKLNEELRRDKSC